MGRPVNRLCAQGSPNGTTSGGGEGGTPITLSVSGLPSLSGSSSPSLYGHTGSGSGDYGTGDRVPRVVVFYGTGVGPDSVQVI